MKARRPMCQAMIPDWICTCCELGDSLYERAGSLYDSWRHFVQDRGHEPGSPAEFADAMERRGFTCDRIPPVEPGRIRWGLRLR
jgi:hypothetical protein